MTSWIPFSNSFKFDASGLVIIFNRSSLATSGDCVDHDNESQPTSPLNLTLEEEVSVPDSALSFGEMRKLEIRPAFLAE